MTFRYCDFIDTRFKDKKARCKNEGIAILNNDEFYPFEIAYNFLCDEHRKTVKLWVKNHK